MSIQFAYSKFFLKDLTRLRRRYRLIEDDLEALKADMRRDDYRGDLMPGYAVPLYKVRMANRSARRGKRGGFRVIYRQRNLDSVLFLHIYSKSDKSDVSEGEISRMLSDLE